MLKHKTVLGSQGPGAPSFDFAYLVQRTTGAQINIVAGYNGSTQIALAMERGEVEGVCGWNWSGVKAQKPAWVRDRTINILAQVGIVEDAELTKSGVPMIWKFIADPENRKIAEFILAQKGFERPMLVRAGTPPELVDILRTAFDATMRDPQFLADAEKSSLEISPRLAPRCRSWSRPSMQRPSPSSTRPVSRSGHEPLVLAGPDRTSPFGPKPPPSVASAAQLTLEAKFDLPREGKPRSWKSQAAYFRI